MNFYTKLAKEAVETYVTKKQIITPPKDLPPSFFQQKAGVFVSIFKNNHLRGCIGTYLPTQPNIALEIINNAIAAASSDFRFSPIQPQELNQLSYQVYLLEKPQPIKNLNELNPKKYGILIQSESGKSGLLLPNLEGVDTVEKQISIACSKGGIIPTQEKIVIYKFKAKNISKINLINNNENCPNCPSTKHSFFAKSNIFLFGPL